MLQGGRKSQIVVQIFRNRKGAWTGEREYMGSVFYTWMGKAHGLSWRFRAPRLAWAEVIP